MGYLIGGNKEEHQEEVVVSSNSKYKDLSDKELRRLRTNAEKEISRCNNIQMARKIQLNSAYGAIGNQYFRYYKLANAEAITLSGQVSIRWIENKVNGYLNKLLQTEEVDYVIASDTDSIYLNMGPLVTKFFGRISLSVVSGLLRSVIFSTYGTVRASVTTILS